MAFCEHGKISSAGYIFSFLSHYYLLRLKQQITSISGTVYDNKKIINEIEKKIMHSKYLRMRRMQVGPSSLVQHNNSASKSCMV